MRSSSALKRSKSLRGEDLLLLIDPCRLVRHVNKIRWLQRHNLIHLPNEPAGV